MMAIGNNLARGLGMMGALTIIRFRTNLKDPRDIIFIFASLATGMAAGVGAFSLAVVGVLGFCTAAFALLRTPLGTNSYFDGVLRFSTASTEGSSPDIRRIMEKYCRKFVLITLRDTAQGERLEHAYQIKLRGKQNQASMLAELRHVGSLRGVQLLLQDSTVEL